MDDGLSEKSNGVCAREEAGRGGTFLFLGRKLETPLKKEDKRVAQKGYRADPPTHSPLSQAVIPSTPNPQSPFQCHPPPQSHPVLLARPVVTYYRRNGTVAPKQAIGALVGPDKGDST